MLPPLRTIGLLGGSFNPAHRGHVHISREALKRLGVDQLLWLVAPHNPLKQKSDLADFEERLAVARQLVQHEPKIEVSALEKTFGTQYTYDTLRALKRRYPRVNFIWIMGADNLSGFHRWQHWRDIFKLVPIAVFDRAPFSHHALRTRAAIAFRAFRVPVEQLGSASRQRLPAWSYAHIKRDASSSTQIRSQKHAIADSLR